MTGDRSPGFPALLAAFPPRAHVIGAGQWRFIHAKRVPYSISTYLEKGGVTVAATAAELHGASLESTSQISIS